MVPHTYRTGRLLALCPSGGGSLLWGLRISETSAEVTVELRSREACPERGNPHIWKIWGEGMPLETTALDEDAQIEHENRDLGHVHGELVESLADKEKLVGLKLAA